MADSENIGGISVSIGADYSQLKDDIDKATSIASQAGADLAKALNAGAAGADNLSGAMGAAADAAGSFESQVQALIDSGSTLAEALEQVDHSLLPIATDATASAEGLKEMASTTTEVGNASKQAAPAVGDMSKSTGSLLKELMAFGAAAGGIAAIIALGKEALEAADAVGDAALAMGKLSGNAEQATLTVEELRNVANDAALGFPEILTAATRMTAFLGTTEQVPDVLRAVADSAAVMNKSIEGSAGAFERIVASGELSKRSLQNLGLTMDDVAAVMGLSGQKMKDAFEQLDQSVRVEVMIAAMKKFKGAAKEMSDDSIGGLQRLKNQFFESLEAIGNAIEPVINAVIKLTGTLMESFAKQAIAIGAAVKAVAEGAKSLFYTLKGDWASASQSFEAMRAAWNKGEADLKAFDERHKQVNKTVEEGTHLTEAEIKAQAAAALARKANTEAAKKQQEVLEALNKSVKDFTISLPASFEEYTKRLENGGAAAKSSLSQVQGAIDKAGLAMESLKGKPLAAMQAVVDKLVVLRDRAKQFVEEDNWNKAAVQIAAFADKYQAELGNLDEATLNWVNETLRAARDVTEGLDKAAAEVKFFKEFTEGMAKLTAETKKLDDQWQKLAQSGAMAVKEYNKTALEAIPITVNLRARVGEAFASMVDFHKEMQKAGFESVQLLDEQIKQYRELVVEMNRTRQPIEYQLAAQSKLIQMEIDRKQLNGEAATSEIYNLEQLRLKQEALYNSTHALGDLAVAVERDMWEGWHMVMQGIADAILEGKNFGDTMEKVGRQVLKMIVDDLVNYAFKELKKAFIGVDSSIQQANKSWDKFMKSITDAMKPVAAKPGDAKTPGGKTPGGTLNTIGVIAEVATAISSIISNFQFAAMNKSLDIIVEHTLRIFNVLDQWYLASQDWFGQMFTRMGEIWRDMVIGFDDVVNALDGARGSGGGGANPIPGRPGGGDRRPIGGDRDAPAPVTTYPTDTPPPIFTVPGVPFIPKNMPMSGPGAGTYAQAANNSQKIGDMTFNVFESANPRETARAIAGTLRQISPRFSAYST